MFPETITWDGTVQPDVLMKALGAAIAEHLPTTKAQTVGAPLGPYLHGPGGLFGVRGLERDIIHTHLTPRGLASILPAQGTEDQTPLFPYITGFVRSDTQEKNAVCDNPETAGQMKTCILTTPLGRKEYMTRQAEINAIGRRINRGEFKDLRLLNSPLVGQLGGILRQAFSLSDQNAAIAGREILMRFIEVGVAFQRWFTPQVFIGNPGNNSAGGGYKEFQGLDLLIGTNKRDAVSGQTCPSLYSLVRNFAYSNVDSTGPNNIVNVLTYMMRYLKDKADRQNFGATEFNLVMREGLFYEITAVWPCNYMTYRCAFPNSSANGAFAINDFMAVQFRDAMRSGRYLVIDGAQVPVVFDDGISEQNNADNAAIPLGAFASDIYIVPRRSAVAGELLYWEYYDYRRDVLPAASDARLPFWFWSDGGIFLWALKAPDNWCLETIVKTEPRLILRAPQLAGRLQNIVYSPLIHTDDALPSQDYFLNGGVSTGYPGPSPYYEANPGGPGINP